LTPIDHCAVALPHPYALLNWTGTQSGDEDIFVTLISVANCAGRLISGAVSDLVIAKTGGKFPRPALMSIACFIMALAFALVASWSTLTSLYIASVLIGACFGGCNALNPAFTSEIFGLKHFGSIYGTFGLSLAAGSFAFAHSLAGALSDNFSNFSVSDNCVPLPSNMNGLLLHSKYPCS